MKKKSFLVIFTIVVIIFSLLGCSKREKAVGKKLLTWTAYASPEWNIKRRELVKKFEKSHPDIRIKFNPISQHYHTKILTQVASGTLPDLFIVPGGCEYEFSKKGLLLNLSPYVEKDKEYFDKFHPFLLEFMTDKGKLFGLPNNVGLYSILYYNKDIFDKEGLSYPEDTWTWDEFLEAAKKLTKRDEREQVIRYGATNPDFWAVINSFGGKMWNEDKTECIFSDPEVIKALHFYEDLHFKHRIIPTRTEQKTQQPVQMFLMGKTAMFFGASFTQSVFNPMGGMKFKWGVVPMPIAKKGKREPQLIGYLRLAVSSKTKYPDEAVEFLKCIVSPQSIIDPMIKMGDSLPVRISGIEYEYYMNEYTFISRKEKKMLWDLLISGPRSYYNFFGHPYIPWMLIENVIGQLFDEFVLLHRCTAEEAAKNMQEKLNSLILEYKK